MRRRLVVFLVRRNFVIRVIKIPGLREWVESIKPRYSHTKPLIDPNQITSLKRGQAIVINSRKSKIRL